MLYNDAMELRTINFWAFDSYNKHIVAAATQETFRYYLFSYLHEVATDAWNGFSKARQAERKRADEIHRRRQQEHVREKAVEFAQTVVALVRRQVSAFKMHAEDQATYRNLNFPV